MGRHIAANALTLLIVALAVLAAVIAWGQREFTTAGPLEAPICLRVERGASLAAVSEQLADEGAVNSATIFRIAAQYTDQAGQLRFGSYVIEPGASMADILERITTPGAEECRSEVVYRIGVTATRTDLRAFDVASNAMAEPVTFDWGGWREVEEEGDEVEPVTEDDSVMELRERMRELEDSALDSDELAMAFLEGFVEQAGIDLQIDSAAFRVVLAEGTTVARAVDALEAAPFLSGEIGETPPEGMLAPGSYVVTPGEDRGALIARMQAGQEEILSQEWEARVEGLPYADAEEALIMASIIEKETGLAEERRKIAGVFVNRLERPMRLQTDPTVIYGITQGREPLGRGLRQSELRAETPWNTYVIDGLPPTPIANPGRDSIAAALDPEEHEYLYFVADGTNGHAFATNLADHNRNVAEWRRIEAERAAEQE